MNIRERLLGLFRNAPPESGFATRWDSYGAIFKIAEEKFNACSAGEGDDLTLRAFLLLRMLAEQAIARSIDNGFVIDNDELVRLGEFERAALNLPPPWPYAFKVDFDGLTSRSAFSAQLSLIDAAGSRIRSFKARGPLIELGQKESFLASSEQWIALQALQSHTELTADRRTEYQNLDLVFRCQEASRHGVQIDLAHFADLKVVKPNRIGVRIDELLSGAASLSPDFGEAIDPDMVKERLGQISGRERANALKVGKTIVLLDDRRLAAAEEILSNRTIHRSQVKTFFESPSAFLDAAVVDLDLGFSLRVKGVETYEKAYFTDPVRSSVDWFEIAEKPLLQPEEALSSIETVEELAEAERRISEGIQSSAASVDLGNRRVSLENIEGALRAVGAAKERIERGGESIAGADAPELSEDAERVAPAVLKVARNDDQLDWDASDTSSTLLYDGALTFERLKREPFPHQVEGIRWILGHALRPKAEAKKIMDRGALLADDMGLGKTFTTLVAIDQFYRSRRSIGAIEKPVLVVAPLGLMQNWRDEVESTFDVCPFESLVTLQGQEDLHRFKLNGAKAETRLNASANDQERNDVADIRYGLKVGGSFGSDRLDMPRRLVLTTYQTLASFQFSLARIDWSFVVFDEAQNIKNPNTLQTRAAKALKGDVKLLVTGTPVENSLLDLWCLFDTVAPGLLGTHRDFNREYVTRIQSVAGEQKTQMGEQVGRKLRSLVGARMLRRTKEDELGGLPQKSVYTGSRTNESELARVGQISLMGLGREMKGEQLAAYDDILRKVAVGQVAPGKRKIAAIEALMRLRLASIHPDLCSSSPADFSTANDAIRWMSRSAKLEALVSVLNEVRARNEKVLVFAISKQLQFDLMRALRLIYRLPVEVVNGDVKTVAKSSSQTRKGIIEKFESANGFNILIISPIAAGVGLTITAANNVVHLERHWNPAKEAQATDRVYRIGQTRPVSVYLPISLHPLRPSFDENLNRLLGSKLDLKDAVMTLDDIDGEELLRRSL